MKKSKTIKLVLITGLLGSAGAASGHVTHHSIVKLPTSKSFKGMVTFYPPADSVIQHVHTGGSSFIPVVRGGWGFWGHHSASS